MDQIYEIKITDIASAGDGIGRIDGLVTFVPGTLPGDIAKIELTENNGKTARGRLLKITEPSADRVPPACPYAGECGGCELMGLSYEAQLRWKQNQVLQALRRIGGIDDPVVRPIIGMEEPQRYRNKAEFRVEGGVPGYYARGSHRLVPVADCLIQSETAMAALRSMDLSRHCVRVVLRTSQRGELMTVFEYDDGNRTSDRRILEDHISCPDTAFPDGKLKVEISPLSFYQVNPVQTEKLYAKVREYAALEGGETVLDLYCGAGSIGLTMADKARRIIGVESVRPAVIDANRNAVINRIVNAEFLCGKAEEVVPTKLQGIKADLVILDPPRAGCKPELLKTVAEIAPKKLIYVSCNPSTLARDLKILAGYGFGLVEATPVDMFPHTLGIEVVSSLVLR